jgi:hypothetical protein
VPVVPQELLKVAVQRKLVVPVDLVSLLLRNIGNN